MSDESIKPPSISNNILNHLLNYFGTKTRVEFKGSCLKQDKISFDHDKIVNIYIVYEINKKYNISSYPVLENCSFGSVWISTNILDMVLDMIQKDCFHLGMKLVKM